MSSSGIHRNGWDARETIADTAQCARLFRPGLADELGSVLGLGSFISGKEILYRTLFSYPIFCSGYHHQTVSLSRVIEAGNLSQCAQCPLPDKGNLPWILSVSPSHHRIPSPNPQAAPTESCISKFSKRQKNSFSSWDKTWSPNNKYWLTAWICKVKQVIITNHIYKIWMEALQLILAWKSVLSLHYLRKYCIDDRKFYNLCTSTSIPRSRATKFDDKWRHVTRIRPKSLVIGVPILHLLTVFWRLFSIVS